METNHTNIPSFFLNKWPGDRVHPDIRLGMIAYLGVPLNYPNKQAFDFNYLFLEAVLKRNPKRTFSVLHARNGKEAIGFCMDIPSIQLVLMDIKMPIDRNLLFQLLEKHLS